MLAGNGILNVKKENKALLVVSGKQKDRKRRESDTSGKGHYCGETGH